MILPTLLAWLDSLAATGQVHRLGWVVIHSVWQAAAVAALLAVALRYVPRRSAAGQDARYVLATLALFSLPPACGITWTLIEPSCTPAVAGGSRMADTSGDSRENVAIVAASGGPSAPAPLAPAGETGRPRQMPAAVPGRPDPAAASAAVATMRGLVERAAGAAEPWLPVCAGLWLAGVLVAAFRLAIGWSLTRRFVAGAAAITAPEWQARLARWTSALGITFPIRLVASTRVDVPIVVGWLRPVVVWPVAAVTGMPPEQIDAILAHELAHVRRHDVFVNLLQSVIEAVFFHHPAAWWISAQVRAEREHCADELAVRALAAGRAGSRITYASALVALEERRQAVLVAAANGGSLGDRIRRLAGIEQTSGHPARLAAAAIVLVCVFAAILMPLGDPGRRADAAPREPDNTAKTTDEPTTDAFKNDGPLADTNTIKSLTPEQAERLICRHRRRDIRTVRLQRIERRTERKADNVITVPFSVEIEATYDFHGDILSLPALERVTPETAAVLGRHNGVLHLDGISSLDEETAARLAAFDGELLSLHGLVKLDPAAATALGRSQARRLNLDGLSELDAATARGLAGFTGAEMSARRVVRALGTTIPLTPDAARLVCKVTGPLCELEGVTAIDSLDAVAVAQALAKREGPLSLPRLKKISPKTLSALLEKEDVQIPGIESLELLAEPDGSPTDDFVIPADFRQ